MEGLQGQEAEQTTMAHGIQTHSYLVAKGDALPTWNKNPTDQALLCNPEGVFIESQYIKHQRGHHDSSELTAATEPGLGAEPPR